MNDRINALLAETHNDLRAQLDAAQQHFHRLETLLATRDTRDIAALNHAARRLRSSGDKWTEGLLDVAAPFASRVALFSLRENWLHLEAQEQLPDIPLDAAPAFKSAAETSDRVVAVRSRGEMSAPVAARFGETVGERFYLFPISTRRCVVALLYADGPQTSIQPDALEILATLTGAILDTHAPPAPNELVTISGAASQTELQLKAQRFARVQVAEMRLYYDEHVKNGRAERDLYSSLQPQIDSAREEYRREFLENSKLEADYLHEELVHTLAHDDVELLGPDYPGPLA